MRVLSKCLFNTDRPGTSTRSLGKPVPVFDQPHRREMFPNVQCDPPLLQLCTIPMHPVISFHGKETGTSLSTSPSQEVVKSNEAFCLPFFLQTRQPRCPQALLTGHAFQPFDQLCCPPLDAFNSTSFFCCGAQNSVHDSRGGLTNAEYSRRLTSLTIWLCCA